MTIQASQGLAVICNLCSLTGPLVKTDFNRYNHQGPGNEIYTKQQDRKAFLLAKKDGFVCLEKLTPTHLQNDMWGNPIQNGQIVNKMHLCPRCIDDIKMQKNEIEVKLTGKEKEEK
jgi:hypothetical protein